MVDSDRAERGIVQERNVERALGGTVVVGACYVGRDEGGYGGCNEGLDDYDEGDADDGAIVDSLVHGDVEGGIVVPSPDDDDGGIAEPPLDNDDGGGIIVEEAGIVPPPDDDDEGGIVIHSPGDDDDGGGIIQPPLDDR